MIEKGNMLFTSESVTEGHPDKLCDQVSDAVLDAILASDKNARVACECACATGIMMIMGEITTTAHVDIPAIARQVIIDAGYDRAKYGFDGETCSIITTLNRQSPDIARGVDNALETRGESAHDIGAGDQGMMFGYACDETPEYMPLAIALAHRLTRRLAEVRKAGIIPYLRPDGKSQVTVEYRDGVPTRVQAVVVSGQHNPDISHKTIESDIMEHVVRPVIDKKLLIDTCYYINPTGRFVIGGPMGDSGLTGRKIIVDTYGGYAHHGGGAFSGKDPTKVDRSAAYAVRHVAKNIVAAGLATRCEVGVAYAIGVAHPVSLSVDTFGTGIVSDERLVAMVKQVFDLRPYAIIERFDLRRPIYRATASYGHFGREDVHLPWENLDSIEALQRLV